MMIPEAVFSSAAAASTTTLSPIGLMFNAIIMFCNFYISFKFSSAFPHQLCHRVGWHINSVLLADMLYCCDCREKCFQPKMPSCQYGLKTKKGPVSCGAFNIF